MTNRITDPSLAAAKMKAIATNARRYETVTPEERGWNSALDACIALTEARWPEADDLLDDMKALKISRA